ncbi:putative transposable element [Trichonephila clavipes]|uniref:Putative transposable element n=1 Tax=Trichonephila clavipes TaxID=2585209 RepID=A0A8X6VHM0_TRICX|nr:putative transposable element [Trichonephila clavipes]
MSNLLTIAITIRMFSRKCRLSFRHVPVTHETTNIYRNGDEVHFWLNGYVNKQNCRIWSEANPQVSVETPLHPEKLTVWCALWAGGILLQKR